MGGVRNVRLYFALGVAIGWAIAYIVSVASRDYTGLTLLTPVLLMAAGYLLTTGLRNGNGNGKG